MLERYRTIEGGGGGGGGSDNETSGTERHKVEVDDVQQSSTSFAWIFEPLLEHPR